MLNDWQIVVALVSGFIAKESVVSTLEILFADGIQTMIEPVSAASFSFSAFFTLRALLRLRR